jgi:DNA-3-methyladenine glycosylase
MFGPPGHLYVYRSYGIHWCLNFTCREAGYGAAVLIRALEPTHGIPFMHERRKTADTRLLCAGPGRLCQALDITGQLNGSPLDAPRFVLLPPIRPAEIISGPRIGISKAIETPWRFGMADSHWLSRSFRKPA